MPRTSELTRTTKETSVEVKLDIDGSGEGQIQTPFGFLDHMLATLTRHSGFDLRLTASGDVGVDDHHTVEDCAIALGRSFEQAIGDRAGLARFGTAYAPLDESLTRAVVDISGRGWPEVHIPFTREAIGAVATENLVHFFRSFALEGRLALHVDLIRGDNDHHKAESAFKAVAIALRTAVSVSGDAVPSTKGVLG